LQARSGQEKAKTLNTATACSGLQLELGGAEGEEVQAKGVGGAAEAPAVDDGELFPAGGDLALTRC